MKQTSIEWTEVTWNPVRGCARVSPGCENCYAERQAHRFSGKGAPYDGLTVLGKRGPRWTGEARVVPEKLDAPLRWRKPTRVFCNSMSDLFHSDVTNEQIAAVFGVMAACPKHTFQLLTKRPQRMQEWFEWAGEDPHIQLAAASDEMIAAMTPRIAGKLYGHFDDEMGDTELAWPLKNVWLGVSCEDQDRADERIPLLLDTPAAVRFVSLEPLLSAIDLSNVRQDELYSIDALTGDVTQGQLAVDRGCVDKLDWVIAGGESGAGARPCSVAWLRAVVRQCQTAGTPCFVKQLGARYEDVANGIGGHQTKLTPEYGPITRLRDRKGGDTSEWPTDLQVRELPRTAT